VEQEDEGGVDEGGYDGGDEDGKDDRVGIGDNRGKSNGDSEVDKNDATPYLIKKKRMEM
jgi:hypothetical protein